MKKKKKDNLGTTKSLSTASKSFLALVNGSCPNFWHCFDELSSVEFDASFSISNHSFSLTTQKIRDKLDPSAEFGSLQITASKSTSFLFWCSKITVRALRRWKRSWSLKVHLETFYRIDLTTVLNAEKWSGQFKWWKLRSEWLGVKII